MRSHHQMVALGQQVVFYDKWCGKITGRIVKIVQKERQLHFDVITLITVKVRPEVGLLKYCSLYVRGKLTFRDTELSKLFTGVQ